MLTSILSAENNALCKATAAQPPGLLTIPRPEKGVAGNGFNLCTAMELGDDHMLYCTVRVSLIFYYLFLLSNHTIPSVAFGTWWTKLD